MQVQDTVRIPLRARDGSIRAYAIVDAADAEQVNRYRWCLSHGFAVRRVGRVQGRSVFSRLNRLILGLTPGDGMEGDHINLDKLDNRQENLRAIPEGKNSQNRPSVAGASSSHRGVSWNKARQKWQAEVVANGQRFRLGYFCDETQAAEAASAMRKRVSPYAVE